MISILKGHRKAIMALAGATLIVLAVLWTMVMLPSMAKIPTDLDKTVTMEGTFTVANQLGGMDVIPVTLTRSNVATGTEGEALLVTETVTVTNSEYGVEMPDFGTVSNLAINRSTMEMVPDAAGADMARQGQWTPTPGEGESFMLWNPAAGRGMEATKTGTEEIRGITCSVYQVSGQDLAAGTREIAGIGTVDQFVTTVFTVKAEPTTGIVVDSSAINTISLDMSAMGMGMGIVPSVITDLTFTQATIDEYADLASSSASLAFIFGTIAPWTLIGLGAVLIATPGILVASRRLFGEKAAPQPTEAPTPSSAS